MPTLILLRHGQSQWNLEDRFTGWVDVDLTAQGEAEAKKGGELIKAAGIAIDRVFTSVLTRAIRTSWLALHAAGQVFVPEVKDWRLNERHYGGLTGLNKTETAAKHGEDQVKVWRRSYDIPPPDLAPGGEFDFSKDRRYAGLDLPVTESLKTTLVRVQPYWDAEIAPCLKAGETLLVAAHGNSLRAIVKVLFQVSDDDIVGVEIPTSNPLVIELDANLKPTAARYLDEGRATKLPAIPWGVSDGSRTAHPAVMTDEDFMRRAIALARAQVGRTGDNPAVGCVIVRDGEIVGEGVTGEGGRPHGEEQALAAAGDKAAGATAYVTMEPCAQRSAGGVSCSERLVAARVARVVVAAGDPSIYAAGRGAQRLQAAGVSIDLGLMNAEAEALYAAYRPAKGLESRR